ncbi:glycosyltransferase [Fulvivirga lutea]|uniref:Glycosyltransferase n=1 Tax=Fulvivirga lutea TaxID=2810512 RepID=A0A974ZZY5_9BACT|nr:glycosyltransferase [Fulvivirga lutea]QSE96804.1 glycosyltransferase [Fulvivirga lutea]
MVGEQFDVCLISTPIALNKTSEEGINYDNRDEKYGVNLIWIKKRTGILRRLLSSREAIKRALEIKPDIIHFHDPDMLPWVWFYSFNFSGKIIYDIHENYCARIDKLRMPVFIRQTIMNLFRWFEIKVINKTGGYVTTTDTMKLLYKKSRKPGIAISNVPYVSRLPTANGIAKHDNITIITSGTNSKARNCNQTIEAIPLVLKKKPEVKFKFVGKYSPENYKQELVKLAHNIGVEHAVEFEGMKPWLENFERVAMCHIGCVFYENNLNNKVTIPNRLFEYMAMELAVIGEDFPEVKKVIDKGNCGVVVDSSQPESIAEGILSIIESTSTKQLGENGRNAVRDFYNFEVELDKLVNYYYQLLRVNN